MTQVIVDTKPLKSIVVSDIVFSFSHTTDRLQYTLVVSPELETQARSIQESRREDGDSILVQIDPNFVTGMWMIKDTSSGVPWALCFSEGTQFYIDKSNPDAV